MTLESKIDATLAALGGKTKCLRADCDQPAEEGLNRWSLHYGLCERHGREHMERESLARLEQSAREERAKRARREAEAADLVAVHRYIGYCKRCKEHTSTLATRERWQDPANGKWVHGYVSDKGAKLHPSTKVVGPVFPCRNCAPLLVHGKEVKGVYNPGIECNAKCQAAKGPNCECRCKGLNHGRAWGG